MHQRRFIRFPQILVLTLVTTCVLAFHMQVLFLVFDSKSLTLMLVHCVRIVMYVSAPPFISPQRFIYGRVLASRSLPCISIDSTCIFSIQMKGCSAYGFSQRVGQGVG